MFPEGARNGPAAASPDISANRQRDKIAVEACQGRLKSDPSAPVEKWTTPAWGSGCERSEGA
jgi:hypothetical protein